MRMVCCRQINGAEARFMPTMAARFRSMRRDADTSPSRATRHNPVHGIVGQRVPDSGGGAVPRPAHGAALRYAVLGRGRWAAGPRAQAHVLGDEAGGAAAGWVSAGVFCVPDTGTDRHGGCGHRSGCTRGMVQSPGRVSLGSMNRIRTWLRRPLFTCTI